MQSVVTQNGAHLLTQSWGNQFTRYQNNQGNWLEQMRGSLMVVATVTATLTFQIAINPPGGVWQSDTTNQQGCARGKTCKAGTSVLAFGDSDQKFVMWLFIIVMCVSVFCTAGAYRITLYYGNFWAGLIVLLGVVFFCRLVFWLLKQFFRFLCCY